jgi:hypothetical protein
LTRLLHFWVPLSLPSTLLLTLSERERTLQISSKSTIIYHQTFPDSNLLLPIHSFIHSPYTKQWVLIRSPIPLTISTNRSLSSCSASLYLNNRFLSFSLISYDLLHSSTITRFQLPLISSRFYFFSLYCIQFECVMWNFCEEIVDLDLNFAEQLFSALKFRFLVSDMLLLGFVMIWWNVTHFAVSHLKDVVFMHFLYWKWKVSHIWVPIKKSVIPCWM